jgi:hypothetical protein
MRNLFLLFIILWFAVPELPAQRYLPGMKGWQFIVGTVNGINPTEGFHAGMALSNYTKRADRWVFGAEYLEKRYPYKELNIPQSQFTADIGYYLKILADPRKTFFMSAGLSAVAGYETVNWNEKLLYDGATVEISDAFIYGGAIILELETYLSDRLVLLTNVRERFLMGSPVGKFNTQIGIGIKIIIN